jgi:hypothetical protein
MFHAEPFTLATINSFMDVKICLIINHHSGLKNVKITASESATSAANVQESTLQN